MSRYIRQTIVKQLGIDGQERLSRSHIAIIGVGGLGCPVSLYLTGSGIGTITLIDHDVVSKSNLHRQVLYAEEDVGKSKAACARLRLAAHNSDCTIIAVAKKISPANIDELLADVDVIVDAADNFAISYLLSDYALKQQKPLVSASVMQVSGYVATYCFNTHTQTSVPSMRALFPRPPAPGVNCNSSGILGTSAGIVGIIQAQEALKVLLSDKSQLAGKLLTIECWNNQQMIMDFTNAPEPTIVATIISDKELSDSDWIIDVRTYEEVRESPKTCAQHSPVNEVIIQNLPNDKRLVFTCSSGQRALSLASQSIELGYENVAIWI